MKRRYVQKVLGSPVAPFMLFVGAAVCTLGCDVASSMAGMLPIPGASQLAQVAKTANQVASVANTASKVAKVANTVAKVATTASQVIDTTNKVIETVQTVQALVAPNQGEEAQAEEAQPEAAPAETVVVQEAAPVRRKRRVLCGSDNDCAGDLVCEKGRCVNPSPEDGVVAPAAAVASVEPPPPPPPPRQAVQYEARTAARSASSIEMGAVGPRSIPFPSFPLGDPACLQNSTCKFLIEKCNVGDMSVCKQLGSAYRYGLFGVAKNLTLAAAAFDATCSSDARQGCMDLAIALWDGSGVDADKNRSLALMKQECAGKVAAACNIVGTWGDKPFATAHLLSLCDQNDWMGCTYLSSDASQKPHAIAQLRAMCAAKNASACSIVDKL